MPEAEPTSRVVEGVSSQRRCQVVGKMLNFGFVWGLLLSLVLLVGCKGAGSGEAAPVARGDVAVAVEACEPACFPGQRCRGGRCTGLGVLSVEALQAALMSPHFVLVNVRVPSLGTIPGTAATISNEAMEDLVAFLGPHKDRAVVLYCRTSPRALQAAEALLALGYENVSYVEGGITAWQAAALPEE